MSKSDVPMNRSARLKISRLVGSAGDRSRRRLRRRLSAGLLLLMALTLAGGLAAVLTPRPPGGGRRRVRSRPCCATASSSTRPSCITCHGANLQGVADRGPSLVGVGEAAVYFQVSTGRMPAMSLNSQAPQKAPNFDDAQIDALGAYVQANGGGPMVVRDANGQIAQESLTHGDVARGGDLFRLNCASCHNFTGKGGALSSGKYAPDLGDASPQEIYTAMLTGPQNMPKFSDRQLSPDEKKDLVATSGTRRSPAAPAATASAASDRPLRACHLDRRNGRRDRRGDVDRSTVMTASRRCATSASESRRGASA